ncbi:hypothetical protein BJ138DRAFT_1005238 [Hygrophoropsis aurantiaca]|uniref:Uncharacterized protein n=1 Tax=Hygrophoropsis aurantiaca TaxID=72124 RepID=A0ACB8AGR0_9AGAM|nr:hypothetical protein BJ138DRAFT_1005238 [Hygrophoropsis aurantiaca]
MAEASGSTNRKVSRALAALDNPSFALLSNPSFSSYSTPRPIIPDKRSWQGSPDKEEPPAKKVATLNIDIHGPNSPFNKPRLPGMRRVLMRLIRAEQFRRWTSSIFARLLKISRVTAEKD